MAQTKSYLAMGFNVAIVVVPHHSSHQANASGLWTLVSRDFSFDSRQTLFINLSRRRTRRFVSRSYWSWLAHGRDSALAIEARLAACSALDPEFATLVKRRGVDVIHVNHCFNMGVAQAIAARASGRGCGAPAIILDTHDIQADRYGDCGIVNPFRNCVDAPGGLARDELALSRDADALLHLTLRDLEHFRAILPARRHYLVRPTTRNEMSPVGRSHVDKPVDFLYVGDGHRANARSIDWFLRQVAPGLDIETLRLRIVGGIADHFRDHDPAIYAAYRDIWVHNCKDVRGFYAASRFVIVPMKGGTGISLKLVEALGLGKFVVTTSAAMAGFKGIEEIGGAVIIADTAEEFARAMAGLVSSTATINDAGRALYRRHFSNAVYTAALSQVIGHVVDPYTMCVKDISRETEI